MRARLSYRRETDDDELVMLAEQLIAEARARRSQAMKGREWTVLGIGAGCFTAFALLFAAFAPTDGTVGPIVVVALVAGYALASRVRFEFGNGYVAAEQLVFVPLILLAPLAYVPLLVATAVSLAAVPDLLNGRWSRDRWLAPLADSWFAAGPVLVLAVAEPGAPSVDHLGVYLIAFAAHFGGDLSWSLLRDKLVDGIPVATTCRDWLGVARVDAALTAVAFAITLPASDHPAVLTCIAPVVWLLDVFSREREKRYTAALELQRAYRGTVMLLADVIKFDDSDTAEHSRSVVDLVHAVAGELGVGGSERQELEFAALLHDVGKIAVPKEVLNKPAALSQEEFDVIRTHTIEGELMLGRIGGLLARVGEIVRSCHERWDGRGYPDGLAGEQIPLAARIVFACDAYNAMTTDRPYRAAMSAYDALVELHVHAGSQFDPVVVNALTRVLQRGEPALPTVDAVRAVLARTHVASDRTG